MGTISDLDLRGVTMEISEDRPIVQHGSYLSDLHGGPGGTIMASMLGRDMRGDMSLDDHNGVGSGSWNQVVEYFGCQIDEIYILMSNLI